MLAVVDGEREVFGVRRVMAAHLYGADWCRGVWWSPSDALINCEIGRAWQRKIICVGRRSSHIRRHANGFSWRLNWKV